MNNHANNNKPFKELTLDEMFNDIACTIRKYSKRNLSEDESKREARIAINYMTLVADYIREDQRKKKEEANTIPLELLAAEDRK